MASTNETEIQVEVEVEVPTVPPTRDEIRARILKAKEVKRKVIDFFGDQIEIRQPRLSDIIAAREEENRQNAVVDTLINNAYVPNTDIKLFEDTDADELKALPFGADLIRVSNVIEELSEVNFLDKKPA